MCAIAVHAISGQDLAPKMQGPISRIFLPREAKNRVATQRFRHIKQANALIATCRGRLTNYCAALTKAVIYQLLRWSFSVEKASIHQLHGRQGMPLTTPIWAPSKISAIGTPRRRG